MYVYFGTLAGSLAELASGKIGPSPTVRYILLAASGVLIIIVVVLITRKARVMLERRLNPQNIAAAASSETASSSSSNSSSPSTANPGPASGGLLPNSGNPTSLYLYTFVGLATLALLFMIFGALVMRSIHIRRRRNAVILAAIAAGTYVPPHPNGKRRDDPLAPKPVLWEVHMAPSHDPEKGGWAEILPVAGATLVPVTQQTPGHLRRTVGSRLVSWLPRRVPDLLPSRNPPTITPGLEPPASPPPSPSEPVHLAVLVSMPTRTALGRAEHVGPPVVEFGVAHAAYAHHSQA